MDNIKCISEVIGAVVREEILSYIGKNWRTINYPVTIENLQKKFEEMLECKTEKSLQRKRYRDISERWRGFHAAAKQFGEPISGHFDDCKGNPRCHCTGFLFIGPREITCEFVNAYYPVRCIVEQIQSYCSHDEVITNFDNNWRRLDMKTIIKGLLKILHDVDPDLHHRYSYIYDVSKFKDPENMTINHCPYDCRFTFDKFGFYDCLCTQSAYRCGPVSFINDMVKEIYETRNNNLKSN